MSDRTISSPEQPEAETGSSGYCKVCNDYGYGVFSDIRTGNTDWITDHVGCRATAPAAESRPAREPGDVWA